MFCYAFQQVGFEKNADAKDQRTKRTKRTRTKKTREPTTPIWILENINTSLRNQTSLNQWKNSSSVINWFTNIPNKHKHSFAIFDIDNFYPSISENLLTSAINHAKKYTNITNQDINIIMHSRKSLLFDTEKSF